MTSQRDFKRAVRARMERTGERYSTARAHLLADAAPERRRPGIFASVRHIGGQQVDVAPARNLLADAGLGPEGADGIDEALLFGLAGGVGFLYGVFEYDSGPTMTIVARNDSLPDPFLEEAFNAAGAAVSVQTTSGAKTARRQLDEHLEAGRSALCTVGAGALGYLGLPVAEASSMPRVVRVIGTDSDDLLIDDRSVAPMRAGRDEFAAARAAVRSAKHRCITIDSVDPAHDWPVALRDAVRRGADGFDQPPVPQFASNVGIAGLSKWRRLLTDHSDPKGWPRSFADGRRAAIGLSRLYDCTQYDATAPDAGRTLQAEFLVRAGALTGDDLTVPTAAFRSSAEHWRAVSQLAADADPALAEYCRHSDERAALLDDGADPAKLRELRRTQDELIDHCTVDADTAADLYAQISHEVDAIIELETDALTALRR